MGRTSRTFRLTLSSAGMDLLIDTHCRLIRTTRCLLAWGTTLHVAVAHLDTVSAEAVVASLAELPGLGLSGSEAHFLGAPTSLSEIATRIARRVSEHPPGRALPELGQVYIVALQHVLLANIGDLRTAYEGIAR
jgi:hypothetical protein